MHVTDGVEVNEQVVLKLRMRNSPFLVVVTSTLSEPPLPHPRKGYS